MRIKSSDEVDKRVCIKCGLQYPLQEKYFALAHGSTTRYLTKCRQCIKEYQEEYRIQRQEEQEVGDKMYEIKEIPEEVQKRNLLKAFNYIHLQAFGDQMESNIYWCKKDSYVQLDNQECPDCGKSMEKIGFVETNEGNK